MSQPPAPRTARDFARIELTRAILESAARQLAEVGPAALSVRAVARELGMASSAVYRYFPSRDSLITALLVQSYDDLGAAVEEAEAAVPRTKLAGRWATACHAVRDWAREHPHEYALLYGSPVPGYAAPTDTVLPATRVPRVLMTILADAAARDLPLQVPKVRVPRPEHRALAGLADTLEAPMDDSRLIRGLMAWTTLFGHLSLELFGHMNNAVHDYDTHFGHVVERMGVDLGLA